MPALSLSVPSPRTAIPGLFSWLSRSRDEIVFGTAAAIKLGTMGLCALGIGVLPVHVMAPRHIVRTITVAPTAPIAPAAYRPVAWSSGERQVFVRTVSHDGRVMVFRVKS